MEKKQRTLPGDRESINEVLLAHANDHPDLHFLYFRTNDDRELSFTFTEVVEKAGAFSRHLLDRGLRPGDRVMIVLPTCPEYVFSFYGTLLAGGIPVPAAPPLGFRGLEQYVERIDRIFRSCDSRFLVLNDPRLPAELGRLGSFAGECAFIDVAAIDWQESAGFVPRLPRPGDLCFIQYTSGSTGNPKGVPITHANILANIRSITRGLRLTDADNGVTWLPLYHDMGLIGGMLVPLYSALRMVFFPPESFIFQPVRWLRYITAYRATISLGNNFAFGYCVRKISESQLDGLDLRSWRVALNGAEPISIATIEAFVEKFSPAGFRRSTMLPCYGLAEASLAVTFGSLESGPRVEHFDRGSVTISKRAVHREAASRESVRLVSVGKPLEGMAIRVAGPDGETADDGGIGEILVRGDSVIEGYYRDPSSRGSLFHEGWLKTGDMGFLHDGELYVIGRKKEMVIIRGKNYYPVDIENVLRQEGVMTHNGVAFSFIDPRTEAECLGIVLESDEQDETVRNGYRTKICTAVAKNFGITPDGVLIVQPKSIPKTANGKVMRSACGPLFSKKLLQK